MPAMKGLKLLQFRGGQAPGATVVSKNWKHVGIVEPDPSPQAEAARAIPDVLERAESGGSHRHAATRILLVAQQAPQLPHSLPSFVVAVWELVKMDPFRLRLVHGEAEVAEDADDHVQRGLEPGARGTTGACLCSRA